MERRYGPDGKRVVTEFLQHLHDDLNDNSEQAAGDTVWVLRHFDLWLQSIGKRVMP